MAGGIPLGQWSGSDATDALRTSIETFQAESSRQTATMIRLTWTIAGLTVVMLGAVLMQIYLTIWPPH
jgi:hypothetical protein